MSSYLTPEEQAKLRNLKNFHEDDIASTERSLNRAVEFREQNWTKYPELSLPPRGQEYKVALVGLGGAGKSTLGNVLTGEDHFQTGASAEAVTDKCKAISGRINGRDIRVLDTPGYLLRYMNELSQRELLKKSEGVIEGMKQLGDELHAVIFVINGSGARNRKEELDILQKSQVLTSNSLTYCMLVVTSGSQLYEDNDVDDFLNDASTEPTFGQLLQKIKNRVVVVELKSSGNLKRSGTTYSNIERELTRDMILKMVGKVQSDNQYKMLGSKEIMAGPCFPPKARAFTPSGQKEMQELKLDDEVLVVDQKGQAQYERVIMFSHAALKEVGCFLSISTEDRKVLRLSPGHLVHVGQVGLLKPARDVKAGDVMFTCGQEKQEAGTVRSAKVTEVSNEWFTAGIFCPHTPSGSIIVDGVLASCYTDLMSPTLAHALMFPVRTMHRVLPEDWFVWLMPYNSDQGMPKVLWSMRNAILGQ